MPGSSKKKPATNLTLSHEIKNKASEVMKVLSFDNMTAFVEQLIRDKHAEVFGVNPQAGIHPSKSDKKRTDSKNQKN